MAEIVAIFFRRFQHQAKSILKILLLILPLVRDMGWIVNHHVNAVRFKGHLHIIPDHAWPITGIYIKPNNGALTAYPEPAPIDSCV